MVTKEQAVQAADDLLAHERARLATARDARAPRVSWPYRVAGLSAYSPAEQAQCLRQAQAELHSQPRYWFICFAWLAVFSAFWFWVLRPQGFTAPAALAVALVGLQLLRVPFLRHTLALSVARRSSAH